ncbi:MAG: ATP-binding protein [Actinobacteria bacterium]|nr:ATP-binding protein [Actinomycetota bacterium]
MQAAVDTHVPCDESSPRRAREFVADVLTRASVTPRTRDDAVLLVSEVVTNAVRHAHSDAVIAVNVSDEHLRIGVTDQGPGWPEEQSYADTVPRCQPGGLGLQLVAELAGRWGTYRVGEGKTVWFELSPVDSTA